MSILVQDLGPTDAEDQPQPCPVLVGTQCPPRKINIFVTYVSGRAWSSPSSSEGSDGVCSHKSGIHSTGVDPGSVPAKTGALL